MAKSENCSGHPGYELSSLKRKKSAVERRAQRLRAKGRRLQHAFSALNLQQRGGKLTKFGHALREALMQLDHGVCDELVSCDTVCKVDAQEHLQLQRPH